MASCGSASTEAKSDSTAVAVDTTATPAADSVKADTAVVK
jgi:hypothetical protein